MYEDLGKKGGGGGGGGGGKGGGGGGWKGGGGGGWKGGGGKHHHHHGGFIGPGWGWGPGWGGPWDYPGSELVVIEDRDRDRGCDERALAYVMSLPKAKRVEAYVKLCGKLPPEGALGAFDVASLTKYAIPVGVGLAFYFLFVRKTGRRGSRGLLRLRHRGRSHRNPRRAR